MHRVRAVLVAAALLAGAACSAEPDEDAGSSDSAAPSDPTSSTTASPSPSPSAASPTSPPTPAATRYRPHPAEVDGAVKRVAARAVEALEQVRQVTYTQYFGYQPPLASILTEAEFDDGGGTTYDVRLTQRDGRWEVDSVTPAEERSEAANLSRPARRVLRSDRIDLPPAAREDVAAGLVADSVLRSMLAVAEEHRIGISVLIAAHPVNVFGTDRRSNHPDGLAYDIGRVDGRLVVEPGARALVRDVMRAAAATGARQVGGPEDLDGGGSQFFADVTHSEHLHVGFSQ